MNHCEIEVKAGQLADFMAFLEAQYAILHQGCPPGRRLD
jgi:hypothetical protein